MKKKERKKSYGLIFLMLFVLTSGVVPDHALYIGVVQIIHEEKEALTTVQIKVFSDDLQSVLQNELGYDQVSTLNALCETTEPIGSYFKNQLTIKVNEQTIDFQIINCEQINDVHLITFTSDQENDWNTCSISAPFFMELFPLQSNIINIKYKPIEGATIQKMDRLTKGSSISELIF